MPSRSGHFIGVTSNAREKMFRTQYAPNTDTDVADLDVMYAGSVTSSVEIATLGVGMLEGSSVVNSVKSAKMEIIFINIRWPQMTVFYANYTLIMKTGLKTFPKQNREDYT